MLDAEECNRFFFPLLEYPLVRNPLEGFYPGGRMIEFKVEGSIDYYFLAEYFVQARLKSRKFFVHLLKNNPWRLETCQ